MFPDDIADLAASVVEGLVERGMTIATAESCTGGLVAGALTSVSGSSDAVYGGFVSYANEAKMAMLGVTADTLAAHGAVSEPTARAMAEGARAAGATDVAISITGIAGPSGGSDEKPVGLVYIACATAHATTCRGERFGAIGRQEVRLATVRSALELVLEALALQP